MIDRALIQVAGAAGAGIVYLLASARYVVQKAGAR